MWIIGGAAAAVLLWDTLLGWFGHAIILALEWLELTVDVLYEEVLSLTPEASQMATAWTGFLAALALLVWGGWKLRRLYLNYKDRGVAWKQARQEEFRQWWRRLSWLKKLGYVASVGAFLALMILTN